MITEIRYKNFKALRDATLPLGRFTLIVGANGTGKTTAIGSLNILKNPQKFSLEQIISVNAEGNDTVTISLIIDNTTIYPETWNSQGYVNRYEESESTSNITVDKVTKNLEKYFEDDDKKPLLNSRVFSFDSDKIAECVAVRPNIELDENGSGLAGVLDQLRDSDDKKFEELNNELTHWFPEFERILFEVPVEGKKSFLLRTKFGQHKIKAKDLSNGIRLALAYLAIAYLPNPPKIVAFEEPERGIHPRLLRNIQEAMDRLAYPESFGEKREPVQVIATTHSPYLLDLYKDRREEIVIADKDENGVHFERLSDMPNIDEIVQDAPLGEVWYTGVLGGVPA
jgi:predicted ATPase